MFLRIMATHTLPYTNPLQGYADEEGGEERKKKQARVSFFFAASSLSTSCDLRGLVAHVGRNEQDARSPLLSASFHFPWSRRTCIF